MKVHIYSFLGLMLTITAAIQTMQPNRFDFSDYLNSVKYQEHSLTVKGSDTPFTIALKPKNDYTALINVFGVTPPEKYLFMAFSTKEKTKIDTTLPQLLQNELSAKQLKPKINAVVKIYRTVAENPNLFAEVASIDTEKKLDPSIINYLHINKMYIDPQGNLIIKYQDIKNKRGENIKKMRVTYERR